MKEIQLTKGMAAIVDISDYDNLSEYKWCFLSSGYAHRRSWPDDKVVLMHRQIMAAPKGVEVDHINGNKLDNRRENLRLSNRVQNARNREKCLNPKTSKYKGVFKKGKRWAASIKENYKNCHLGYFDTQEQVAAAYNEAAKIRFGEYACLNVL